MKSKKIALVLTLIYFASIFTASAQTVQDNWECPPGEEFPVYQDSREVMVQCSENGSSATLYGCENMTNIDEGVCYQEPDTVTGKVSEQTESLVERVNGLDQDMKIVAAASVLLAITAFFYEYFHG